MYSVLAVAGYRSLRDVRVTLGRLTVVTGPNGAGKSSLYRALRLLADCGQGRVVASLAREGGLQSALWAGPATLGGARRSGRTEGTIRKEPISLRLGVGGVHLGYLVDLGLPPQSPKAYRAERIPFFLRDPEIKREAVFQGPVMRPATLAARRRHQVVELRGPDGWERAEVRLPPFASLLTEYSDPASAPALWAMRSVLRRWRFYDGFRADPQAPARLPQVGTRTGALADDGADLAAALATILEQDPGRLHRCVGDAFPGATLDIQVTDGMFDIALQQPGMLRALRAAELSDGTLRYLLWLAALLTIDPPPFMVLNEPETSLHPSLLPPLARLIGETATRTQVLVVTHSQPLLEALAQAHPGLLDPLDDDPVPPGVVPAHRLVDLATDLGETVVVGQGLLSRPTWEWGRR
ncbi:putative ATPase [Kineosphaera limosa]|uniref:ATPase AAA-type core domain-containing protein n=1 Tax=Kineosphaera limosa NBRC 100340 TaxID=1184609 RepID=K6WUL2_9MICO|nr:AAA family ATPase [Kineosphaera limosa]NYE00049.1 putative ATPase [Kineosphaera limosa]GAB95777.1 hypothetical protein KILIM_026_00480 [Kineosphaera limosa NBRC 100340]